MYSKTLFSKIVCALAFMISWAGQGASPSYSLSKYSKNEAIFKGNEYFFYSIAVQQSIMGSVTDETGRPLPGATVLEKGKTNGTTTDFDGNFYY